MKTTVNTKRLGHQSCKSCASRANSVFHTMETDALTTLDKEKNSSLYKRGQTLFLEGNPPFCLYCVNSGKIKVTKLGSNGKETIVRIATTGDLLGHLYLFSGTPYSVSATVIEDAKICLISKNTIQNLIQNHPALGFEIIQYLAYQMETSENRLASFSQKNIRKRFGELLIFLKEVCGVREGSKIKLNIQLTREEMASMIGVATENLIRLVTEFKDAGFIEQKDKTIYLLNISKIEACAL